MGRIMVSQNGWEGQPQRVRARRRKTDSIRLDPEYRRTRETRWETGGPPSKPKYYLMTDRGAVP